MVGISDVKTAKKGWVLPGSHVLSSTNWSVFAMHFGSYKDDNNTKNIEEFMSEKSCRCEL
jgi:hypothetical protein